MVIGDDGLEITRYARAIHRDKGDGTVVDYYIFPEYEIHYNTIAPGSVQQWHHHEAVEETILVISGQLEVRWRDDEGVKHETIRKGDLVRVARSVHTFANPSMRDARFVVLRLVLDGEDKRELIKNDKVSDEAHS